VLASLLDFRERGIWNLESFDVQGARKDAVFPCSVQPSSVQLMLSPSSLSLWSLESGECGKLNKEQYELALHEWIYWYM